MFTVLDEMTSTHGAPFLGKSERRGRRVDAGMDSGRSLQRGWGWRRPLTGAVCSSAASRPTTPY